MNQLLSDFGRGSIQKISVRTMDLYHYNFQLKHAKSIKQNNENSIAFWYCVKGNFDIRINGHTHTVHYGECYVYSTKEDEYIQFHSQDKYEIYCLSIRIPLFLQILSPYLDETKIEYQLKKAISLGITSEMQNLLNKIETNYSNLSCLYLEGKLYELLAMTLAEIHGETLSHSTNSVTESNRRIIQRAKRLIDEDIISTPTTEQLAKAVGMSQSLLCRTFRENYGISVHTYVITQRLNKAAALLEETNIPIQQISKLVGYPKACNFTQAFKKKFGIPPRQYRLSKQ